MYTKYMHLSMSNIFYDVCLVITLLLVFHIFDVFELPQERVIKVIYRAIIQV